MPDIRELLKEYVTSLGDPKAPVKTLLKELWDEVLPVKDQEDLLLNSIIEALQTEAGDDEVAWTKQDLKAILNHSVHVGKINFDTIDSGELGSELQRAFRDVALVPSRIMDKFDFDQIARSIIVRAISIFEERLRAPENQQLRIRLVEEHSRKAGLAVMKIENDLSVTVERLFNMEHSISQLGDEIKDVKLTLLSVSETLRLSKSTNKILPPRPLGKEDLISLRGQLKSYEETLRLYLDHWSEYASRKDIPLQQRKDFQYIKRQVSSIRKKLGLRQSSRNDKDGSPRSR